jgi:hypothetical protein
VVQQSLWHGLKRRRIRAGSVPPHLHSIGVRHEALHQHPNYADPPQSVGCMPWEGIEGKVVRKACL